MFFKRCHLWPPCPICQPKQEAGMAGQEDGEIKQQNSPKKKRSEPRSLVEGCLPYIFNDFARLPPFAAAYPGNSFPSPGLSKTRVMTFGNLTSRSGVFCETRRGRRDECISVLKDHACANRNDGQNTFQPEMVKFRRIGKRLRRAWHDQSINAQTKGPR